MAAFSRDLAVGVRFTKKVSPFGKLGTPASPCCHTRARGSERTSSVTPRIDLYSPIVHIDAYNVLLCCCSGQDDPCKP